MKINVHLSEIQKVAVTYCAIEIFLLLTISLVHDFFVTENAIRIGNVKFVLLS